MDRRRLCSQPRPHRKGFYTSQYYPKVDRVYHLFRQNELLLWWSCLLLLACTNLQCQTVPGKPESFHGSISVFPGRPAAAAAVELWDLRGAKVASGVTDRAGSFEIGPLEPGEYVFLVDNASRIESEQIRLDNPDVALNVVLPAGYESTSRSSRYAVPAKQIAIPPKARAHLLAAQKKFSNGKIEQAEAEINCALLVDPNYAQALTMRAFIRLAVKHPNHAVEDAQRAVLLNANDAESFVALAMAYDALGKFRESQRAAEGALALRADSWQARLELAKSFYGRGDFVVALRELDVAEIDFPDAHLLRGNILLNLGRQREARDEFRALLRELPNDPRRQQVEGIVTALGSVSRNPPRPSE